MGDNAVLLRALGDNAVATVELLLLLLPSSPLLLANPNRR